MAILEPGCCDGPNELLRKILLSLPDISTGGGGDVAILDEGALLTAAVAQINFVGAGVTASTVGNNVTVTVAGSSAGVVQSGAQAIGSAVTTQAVVFPVAFASAPHVVATMSRPTGGVSIILNINSDAITVAGFSVRLSAATPNATYILQWIAHV